MRKTLRLPTQKFLKACLDYDPLTGLFTWRKRPDWTFPRAKAQKRSWNAKRWNSRLAGKPAFCCPQNKGYLMGRLNDKAYLAHRVAWKIMTGKDPVEVDHQDGNRKNNAFSNLLSTNSLGTARNSAMNRNNTSGRKGVAKGKGKRSWSAYITVNREKINLGTYPSFEEAVRTRVAAENKYGFHPNHGKRRAHDS